MTSLASPDEVIDDFLTWWDGSEFVGKMLRPVLLAQPAAVELVKIAVRTEHQRKGIATTVLRRLTDLCDQQRMPIELTARPFGELSETETPGCENQLSAAKLAGLYACHGFIEHPPGEATETAVPMRREPK